MCIVEDHRFWTSWFFWSMGNPQPIVMESVWIAINRFISETSFCVMAPAFLASGAETVGSVRDEWLRKLSVNNSSIPPERQCERCTRATEVSEGQDGAPKRDNQNFVVLIGQN